MFFSWLLFLVSFFVESVPLVITLAINSLVGATKKALPFQSFRRPFHSGKKCVWKGFSPDSDMISAVFSLCIFVASFTYLGCVLGDVFFGIYPWNVNVYNI